MLTPHHNSPHDSPGSTPHARQPALTSTTSGQDTVISILGHLEWHNLHTLAQAFTELAPCRTVTLDLRGLVWADSTMLHLLIDTQQQLRRHGTALTLRGPLQPVPARLFELTGTHVYFTFDDTPAPPPQTEPTHPSQ